MKKIVTKIKKSRIFSLICVLLFIGACFGIGASIAYVQHEADPTDEAVTYFRAFVQHNYEKMYECLYQDEGYYIDKEMYLAEMKKLRESYTIDSYDIQEPEEKDDRKTITIRCENQSENQSKDFVVYIEAVRKGIQPVPDYYISAEHMMAQAVDIIIPKEDRLVLNGNTIDEKNIEVTEETKNHIYHFKGILAGKYSLSATNDVYARNKFVKISGENVKIDLTGEKLTANETYEKLLTQNGRKVIDRFYQAARNRDEKNKKLLGMFSSKKLKNKVSELVEESEDIIYWPEERNADSFKVLDMKINDLKTSIRYSTKTKLYTLTLKYNYKYTSSTDTSLANSYVDQISGKCSSTMTLTYQGNGDSVIVKDIRLTNKNKKD